LYIYLFCHIFGWTVASLQKCLDTGIWYGIQFPFYAKKWEGKEFNKVGKPTTDSLLSHANRPKWNNSRGKWCTFLHTTGQSNLVTMYLVPRVSPVPIPRRCWSLTFLLKIFLLLVQLLLNVKQYKTLVAPHATPSITCVVYIKGKEIIQ